MAGRERRPAARLDATRDRHRHPGDPPTAAVVTAAAEARTHEHHPSIRHGRGGRPDRGRRRSNAAPTHGGPGVGASPPATASSSPSPRSSTWSTFTSERYGYEVRYPAGWDVYPSIGQYQPGEDNDDQVVSDRITVGAGFSGLYSSSAPRDAGTTPQQWIDENVCPCEPDVTWESRTVDGQPALFRLTNMGEQAIELYVFTDERVYRFIGVNVMVRDQPLWRPSCRRSASTRRTPSTRRDPSAAHRAGQGTTPGRCPGSFVVSVRCQAGWGSGSGMGWPGPTTTPWPRSVDFGRQVAEQLLELLGVDRLLGDQLLGQADEAVAVGRQDLRRPLVGAVDDGPDLLVDRSARPRRCSCAARRSRGRGRPARRASRRTAGRACRSCRTR